MPTLARNRAKYIGPAPVETATIDFTTSGSTTAPTTNQAYGCSVARTGVGVFVITLDRAYRLLLPTLSVQASTTAQLFIITAKTTSTITVTQVTAGGGTAVDTLAGRICMHVAAFG